MMQDYLHSSATTTEKIAMGGKTPLCDSKRKEMKRSSEKKAGKSIEEFERKWEKAAR